MDVISGIGLRLKVHFIINVTFQIDETVIDNKKIRVI